MTIVFDFRDGSKQLATYPPWKGDSNVILGNICDADGKPCGDVRMGGVDFDGEPISVLVEVKGISDMLQSMDNGRLQGTQLRRMVNASDECWLAVYGEGHCGTAGELMGRHGTQPYTLGTRVVPFGYFHGFAITLAHAGIHFIHLANYADLAQWIGVLYRWHGKGDYSKHKSLKKLDRSWVSGLRTRYEKQKEQRTGRREALLPGVLMDDHTLFKAGMAMGLPGVGYDKALTIADTFPSVFSWLRAQVDDWIMPGIRKKTAQRIYDKIREGDR